MAHHFSKLFMYETVEVVNLCTVVYKGIRMMVSTTSAMEYAFVIFNLTDGKVGFYTRDGDTVPDYATKISILV
jgi:hypothetical protein